MTYVPASPRLLRACAFVGAALVLAGCKGGGESGKTGQPAEVASAPGGGVAVPAARHEQVLELARKVFSLKPGSDEVAVRFVGGGEAAIARNHVSKLCAILYETEGGSWTLHRMMRGTSQSANDFQPLVFV